MTDAKSIGGLHKTTFTLWTDQKPEGLTEGRILLWKTAHRPTGLQFIMHGPLRKMCNGWTDTWHILPPMTRWDGYQHLIPDDLKWSEDVPEWVLEGTQKVSSIYAHRNYGLVSIPDLPLMPCPFSGKSARWESCDGFIGAMAHQDQKFQILGALKTGWFTDPRRAAAFWNTRNESRT